MKASTKIGIGLSIAAVASVSVAVIASEKIIKKVSHVSNEERSIWLTIAGLLIIGMVVIWLFYQKQKRGERK